MKGGVKDILGEYDFTRTDKFYSLRIPTYSINDGVPFYDFQLKDLVNNEVFNCQFRFKQLKTIHQNLIEKGYEVPPFPKTHFWVKTNTNRELILKRKVELEYYFSMVINDPFLRGYPDIKNIIKLCKQERRIHRKFSSNNIKTECSERALSLSDLNRKSGELITKQEWKKIRRKSKIGGR